MEMGVPAGLHRDAVADPTCNRFLDCVAEGCKILNVVQSERSIIEITTLTDSRSLSVLSHSSSVLPHSSTLLTSSEQAASLA